MRKNGYLGSLVAMAGAAVAVAFLAIGPQPVGGQAPDKGDVPAAKEGGKGGKGGKQAAPPGPVPRTKDGKPDMSGFWGGVTPSAAVNIEVGQAKGGGKGAPKGGKGGAAPGGAAAAKGKATLIVAPEPGRIPYTPAARAKSDDIIANRMFLEPELHCYMSGVPHNMWVQFGMQMLQTKDYLVMMWEFQHSRRIIPLDGRPHQFPEHVRQFQGESVGHWEGDTLVIETRNQTNRTWFDTSGHYAPRDIHVIERLTMLNANQIEYKATVTSPTEFTAPMQLEGMINRANLNDPDYMQMEFGCIEGNIDLEHYPETAGGPAKAVGARTQ